MNKQIFSGNERASLFIVLAFTCIPGPAFAQLTASIAAIQNVAAEDQNILNSGAADHIEHAAISFGGTTVYWHSERYLGSELISVADVGPSTSASVGTAAATLITRSVEPSIYAGRSQQYTVDAPSSGHYLDSGAACWGDTNGTTFYYPGVDTFTWKRSSNFGGHLFMRHAGPEPTLRFEWNGSNRLKLGQNVPPANADDQTSVIILTANDSAAYHLHKTALAKVYLPEVAEEIQLEETLACSNINIAIPLKGTFRVEMNVALQSVADIVSDNRATKLTIQGLGNSHPVSAGYATATTASQLKRLVESYSTCSTRPARGSYPLKSEALSLVNGGLYDIHNDWKGTSSGSHKNHRAGEDADIGFGSGASKLDQADLNCLYHAYAENRLQAPVTGEKLVLDKNGNAYAPPYPDGKPATHVHLWSGETHFYPADENASLSASSASIGSCSENAQCKKEISQ